MTPNSPPKEQCEFLTLPEGPLRVCPIPDQRRGFFTPRNRRVGPKSYVRFGSKTDIPQCNRYVRFTPQKRTFAVNSAVRFGPLADISASADYVRFVPLALFLTLD